MVEVAEKSTALSSSGEQYILFKLGDELFAFNIATVNEITELLPMNMVPRSPKFIKGVINFHGRVIAIHDLAAFFNLTSGKKNLALKRIIVLVPKTYHIGFLVDSVKEITWINDEDEEVNPMEGKDFKNIYVDKVVCIGDTPVNIIDVDKLLADLEDYFKEVYIEH
ncbi:MAG: chemotaxis protein CheW [Deltaproteobacteria bacterium]|nr:chemotaxis protein CheW [Deltaproteobacteria bacterium]